MNGALKLSSGGLQWKKAGGGRSVDVPTKEIDELHYIAVPGAIQLIVTRKDGNVIKLQGLNAKDLPTVREFCSSSYNLKVQKREFQTNGRNWGEVDVSGKSLSFSVDGKTTFDVDCADVASASVQKNEVMLEFHLDDTMAAQKDSLVEMSFYVPPTSEQWGGGDPEDPEESAANKLKAAVLERAETGPGTGDAIAEFDNVTLVMPRGKVSIELHTSFLKMSGQTADFKIQYSSMQRIFLLPKPNAAQSFAIIHLDPPIRKGQTFYPHIVATFSDDEELEVEPDVSPELKAKLDKLEDKYEGPSGEVFVRVLKAIAGVKLTRHGAFQSPTTGGAIKASYKAESGHLFPLEKSFFFLPKPALLLHYSEVESVEFERHTGAHAAGAQRTFDISVFMRSEANHTFHSIQRSEFQNLVNFLTAKGVNIVNVDANARVDALIDDDDDEEEDHHAARLKSRARAAAEAGEDMDEDSEEDEDFEAGDDDSDGGEPTDDSEEEESDLESDEDDDGGKKKKGGRKTAADAAAAVKKRRGAPAAAKKGKAPPKKKAKKDANAPKRGLSAYMFFTQDQRKAVLAEHPGLSVTEVSKKLGEKWKTLDAGGKAKYEAMSKEDKARYEREMKAYKSGGGGGGDDGKKKDKAKVVDDDDDEDEEESAEESEEEEEDKDEDEDSD